VSIGVMSKVKITIIEMQKISSLESLMECGSYLSVKNSIESQIEFKLGVNGWKSLYEKVSNIICYFKSEDSDLNNIVMINKLPIAKSRLYEIFDIKIPAKSQSELSEKVTKLICLFKVSDISAYDKYERNKRRNFINSSKLEGITISNKSTKTPLEDILKKYKDGNFG
jgi:viroplasmin and RNaseH domain-containing protein